MNDYKNEIDILLDSLDSCANANTAWLPFDLNSSPDFDIEAFLLTQLKSGQFHFALVKSDIIRNWDYYVRVSYPENPRQQEIRMLRPGTTWNGTTELTVQAIATGLAQELLTDLMTGAGKHFSRSSATTRLNLAAAEKIVQDFINYLSIDKCRELTFFRISPDFLWPIETVLNEEEVSHKLGYFEGYGTDLALGICINGKDSRPMALNILLVNGY